MVAQFLRIAKQPIPDLREAGIPGDVSAAIEAAMARDTAARPATAAEFGELLRAVQRTTRNAGRRDAPTGCVAGSLVSIGAQHSGREPDRSRRHPPVATLTPPAAATRFPPPPPPIRALVHRDVGCWTRCAPGSGGDTGRDSCANRVREEHARGPVERNILTGEGVAVAWLTVDHDDNNVVWFLAHLIEAIRAVPPGAGVENSARRSRRTATTPSGTCLRR